MPHIACAVELRVKPDTRRHAASLQVPFGEEAELQEGCGAGEHGEVDGVLAKDIQQTVKAMS